MLHRSTRKGFTLIELLVVIAIIAVLIALLLPAVQQAREAARRTQTRNRLKQIGLALHNYHDTHNALPPGWIGVTGNQADVEGTSGWGWAAHLLPYLDKAPLYEQINFSRPVTDPVNTPVFSVVLEDFRAASDTGPQRWKLNEESNPSNVLAELPTANFVACFGTIELHDCEGLAPGVPCHGDGAFYHNSKVNFRDMLDGPSNTLLVGERKTDEEEGWYSTWVGVVPGGEEAFARILGIADHTPNHPVSHLDDFSSNHHGGVHFLFGDGRVRFVSENINLEVFRGLATLNGKEVIGEF